MSVPELHLNQTEFLKCYCFSDSEFVGTGLAWSMLESICARHAAGIPELQATADYVSQRLRQLPAVHSLKIRIKHPEHLVAKIIRKKIERPELTVSVDSYAEWITDLIGIRALHLFKDQWQPIHDFVTSTWELQEPPIAYVRAGDAEPVLKAFGESGCTVREHTFGYRSVHYLIKSQPAKQVNITELQVRTLFEEGWSEIDHQIRYPRLSDDPHLAEFLTIFNRLAGSADEMGSFIKMLSRYIADQGAKYAAVETQLKARENELREAIGKLKISEKEKKFLQSKIEELRAAGRRDVFAPLGVSGVLGLDMPSTPTLASSSVWSSNIISTGLAQRLCAKCGKPFKDDGLFLASDRCPECRGSWFT